MFFIRFDAGFFSVYRFFYFSQSSKNVGVLDLKQKRFLCFNVRCYVTFSLFLFLFTLYFPIFLTKVHPCFTVTVLLSTHLCLIKLPLRQVYYIANSLCISSFPYTSGTDSPLL